MGEKGLNLWICHFFRFPFIVEINVSQDPGDIAFFRPYGVMLQPDQVTDPIGMEVIFFSCFLRFYPQRFLPQGSMTGQFLSLILQ